MKKNLLIAVAALFVAIGVNAQKVAKEVSLNGMKFDKTSVMTSSQFGQNFTSKKFKAAKRAAAADGIYDAYVATETGTDEETLNCFSVTLEQADLTEEGVTYNVKIKDFWSEGTETYGIFNPEDNTLKIPSCMTIWADESLEGLGYSASTKTYGPLIIINIDAEDNVDSEGDIVFVYNEEDGTFSFDDTKTSAYYIYALGKDADGEEIGGWTYAFDVTMSPYNGVMSFSTTAAKFQTQAPREGSSWGYGELPINYEDWGTSVQINGFLKSGSISIGISEAEGTAIMMMHQPLSTDYFGADEGKMELCGVAVDDVEGTISIDATVESMNGFYLKDMTLNDETPVDVIMFYQTDDEGYYTYNEYFIPLTEGQNYWMGGWFCALDVIMYKDDASGVIAPKATTAAATDNKVYTIDGKLVDSNYRGLVIKNGKKMIQK
mgnify:CR=1 FL=1